ncbi:hypothetical protein BDV41DRAFT_303063 [Aspergillus transmontanensis]|uniref:Uncharacterized protein n=1 Tax=Aspergillus transmontanensis TaxID=1034304 RepID=A0A5N6VUL3_9EURO|nr:hypothetical protein BDV41DRAFT_303063 [Aspergillus transmontanensis]
MLGRSITDAYRVCREYRLLDPQTNRYSIGRFPIRNKRQPLKAKGRLKANGLFSGHLDKALRFTLNDNEEVFQKLRTALQESQETCSTSPDLTYIPFCGSLSAKVAPLLTMLPFQ